MDQSIQGPSLLSPVGFTTEQLSVAEAVTREACLHQSPASEFQILRLVGW